ncbi:MAG: PEP-CTERM sorting domain-containing protein [Kiritimatiellales bacterium]|nr:PEP-CTERM sorting domain-containing protein [Kiritimatiellales bacterium]MCF7863887.1 PEP-CTERM sorting domain-containing protein [Kiritimatiellales bacterium]
MKKNKTLAWCMVAMMIAGYASAALMAIGSTPEFGSGVNYAAANNGLAPESGGDMFGFSFAPTRAGVTYVPFSSLGVSNQSGSAMTTLEAGTYQMVLRVASNGQNPWLGIMETKDVGGFMGGFMLTDPSLAAAGADAVDLMFAFNATNNVSYAADTSIVSTGTWDATQLKTVGNSMYQDTWYSVTNTWTVAAGSSVIGSDPWVGVGFKILPDSNGAYFFDDGTLTYAIPEPATLGLVGITSLAILFLRRVASI